MTVVLCCAGLLAAGHPYRGDPPEVIALYRRQVAVARRLVEADRQIRESGAISREEASTFVENELDGIRRLTEAECKLDPTPAGRLAAARTMFVCARDAEVFYAQRAQRGLSREQVAWRASLFRLDAEVELRKAEAAYPADAPPLAAPFTTAPAGYRGKVMTVAFGGRVDIEPVAGLKRFDRLTLTHPGDAKPYGQLVVLAFPPAPFDPNPPVFPPSRPLKTGTQIPSPNPPPAASGYGLVWATEGPAAAVRVGDLVQP